MSAEREYQIHPIVPESMIHNTKTISNFQSLTASLFGITAGVLGLESYSGFLVYIVLSLFSAVLFYTIQIAPESLAEGRPVFDVKRYYHGPFDFWASGLLNGLSGFVLTWTLFYGLVRA